MLKIRQQGDKMRVSREAPGGYIGEWRILEEVSFFRIDKKT